MKKKFISKFKLKQYAKKKQRKENKRMKLKAFIEISQLNTQETKKRGLPENNSPSNNKEEGEPLRKKLRKDVEFPLNGQETTTEVPPVFGELTSEQQKKMKKLLEGRSKKRKERPRLTLRQRGELADLRVPSEKRVPLTTDDFQQFILSSMNPLLPSRWAMLENWKKVERRILLVLEGVGFNEYLKYEAHLQTLSQFEARLEVATPLSYGASLIHELALVPLSNVQWGKLISEYGNVKTAVDAGEIYNAFRMMFKVSKSTESVSTKTTRKSISTEDDKFSRTNLVLTPLEMFKENYPLPVTGGYGQKFANFVKTREEYSEVTANSPMWSIDCEMCLTTAGSELTRICIINEAHEILFESFVKPPNPIVNYLTEFSGITRDLLWNVSVTLEDVQAHICSICPPDVIFVGQSLNFDLVAMKMIHPYVIDTSVIYNLSGIKHRKSKLKVLTEEFLSERIQVGNQGHSPIEDALAAMKLVQLKLQHSVSWGNAVLSGQRSEEEIEAARALLKEREKTGNERLLLESDNSEPEMTNELQVSKSLFSHFAQNDKKVLLVGKENILKEWNHYKNNTHLVETRPVRTHRLGVKVAKRFTPLDGMSILHISLETHSPLAAIIKVNKLVKKLLKDTMPNTLYSILLAGRSGSLGNGLLFLHLLRQHVPFVTLTPPS